MSFKRVLAGCGIALLSGIGSDAGAQHLGDLKTDFTIDRVVELPGGRTLQPGNYVFKVVDSWAGRYLVQVLDQHEVQVLATIPAAEPAQEVIVVGETPAKVPQPIRYWYRSRPTVGPIGFEFVYPEAQAARIARMTNQYVLMLDADMTDGDAMLRAQVRTVDPRDVAGAYGARVLSEGHSSPSTLTLVGLALLGGAIVALRFYWHVRSRPAQWPFEQLNTLSGMSRDEVV